MTEEQEKKKFNKDTLAVWVFLFVVAYGKALEQTIGDWDEKFQISKRKKEAEKKERN